MRILKFADGDAPDHQVGNLSFDARHNVISFGESAPKKWVPSPTAQKLVGCYWLIGDDGKPIGQINDVVVMTGVLTEAGARPSGVEDRHVAGVDLRSKMGRQMEASRAEYGHTYKKATAKPNAMNAEEARERKHQSIKRDRENVAREIESGETPIPKKAKKEEESGALKSESKKSKKSKH